MKEFKPGDMWSKDFDYEGMLRYGENISVNDDVEELEKLFIPFTLDNFTLIIFLFPLDSFYHVI